MNESTFAAVYHEVFLALAHESSDEAFFALLAKKARLLSGAESSAITLLRQQGEMLEFAGAAGENAAELRGTRVRARDSLAGDVALAGELHLSTEPPAAILPIFHENKSVGSLFVFGGPSAFSGDALLALHTLVAAASARVSAMRLRRASNEGLRIAAAIEATSNATSLDTLAELACEHLDADAVAIYLADEDDEMHLAADAGLPESLRGGAREAIDSEGSGLRLAEVAPLRIGERIIGTLSAYTYNPQTDETRSAVTTALARHAANLVERERLREEAARRADEATTLYELSQAVSATLKLSEVLTRAVDAACTRLEIEKCALFLKDPGSEKMRLAASRGLSADAESRLRPMVGEGLPGWVVRFQTPTVSDDLESDLRNAGFPLDSEGVSLVAAPLQIGTETIGVLCGLSSRPRRFTVAELELAYTIANHSAIAIENARVYAETRRQSVALRRYLQGVAHALSSPKTTQNVPDVIASLTREALGADRAALYLAETAPDGYVTVRQLAATGHRASESWLCPEQGDCPAAWVARKSRALSAPNVERDGRFGNGNKWERPRAGAYAAVPLRTDGNTLGVLEVVRRAPLPTGANDLRQLSALARHAALALEGVLRRRKR
ncbi:MAG: GAF domain-containing protein [Armatimonas sp.]